LGKVLWSIFCTNLAQQKRENPVWLVLSLIQIWVILPIPALDIFLQNIIVDCW
jgi:hypothetical protein